MAETNITWDGTRIEEIERDALHLESINRNGTVSEMIDTINANFLEIAKHGGGPSGMNGASGLNGEDGVNVEYIYALCDIMEPNTHYPTDDTSKYNLFKRVKNSGSADHNGVTWHDHAQPISKEHKNEYVFSRFRRNVDTEEDTVTSWIYDSKPVLWAHWGETGQDGDGVEYIFMVSNEEITDPNALDRLIMKKSAMDEYQKAIFNMDDFYPGAGWFTNSRNKSRVQEVFQNLGLDMSDSTFSSRWGDKFGFTAYGEWTDDPTGVGPDKQYEYVSIRRSVTDENDKKVWGDYSTPALWSNYTFEGRIFIIYCNTLKDATPVAPQKGQGHWINTDGQDYLDMTGLPEGWTDNHRNKEDNEITWMSSGIFDHSGQNLSWSNPVCISGKDGKDGEDGTNIQFIYALSPNPNYPRTYGEKEELFNAVENDTAHNPKYSEWGTTRWYDRAQPISQHDPTEYMWARRREKETDPWEYDPEPVIWAHWGEDGTDGDGVEYIFAVTNVEDSSGLILPKIANLDEQQRKIFQIDDFVPSREWFAKPRSKEKAMEAIGDAFEESRWTNYYGFDLTTGWKDDPIPVDHYTPFQWVSIRRSTADEISGDRIWEDFSDPVLWNSYGKSTRVFIIYCNMPVDEEHPDRETPNKPVDGTGTWVNENNENRLDLTDIVDALTGVTPEQKNLRIGVWSDKNKDVRGTIAWMSSGVFTDDGNNISWSEPFRITGSKGEPGEDGDNMEYVYCFSPNMPAYPVPNNNMSDEEYDLICSFFYNVENAKNANLSNPDDPVNEGLDLANIHIDEDGIAYYEYTNANGTTAWYDNALSIDDVPGKKTEWAWLRTKSYDEVRWTFTPKPVIWAHWGEDGTDGDGVEYIFHLSQHEPLPSDEFPPEKPTSTSGNIDKCRTAIYNIRDFYPDMRWFTADTNADGKIDGREDAKVAIVDTGLLSQSEFDELWNAEVLNLRYFNLDKGWTDDPQNTSYEYPFQFVSIRKSYTNDAGKKEWGPYSTPKLWSRYLIQTRIFMVYCNVDENVTPTAPSLDYGWWGGDDRLYADESSGNPYEAVAYNKDHPETQAGVWVDSDVYEQGKIAWLCSITFAENGVAINCSEPFRITGDKGRPGADGTNIEFVYARCDVEADLKYPDPSQMSYNLIMEFFDNVENAASAETPTIDENGKAYYNYNGTHWYDNPQGVSPEEGRTKEWVWSRNKPAGDSSTLWTVPPKPVIWSHWGEDGTDGDGVEYIFCLSASNTYNSNISETTWSNYWNAFNANATAKAVYGMDDFVPTQDWFSDENKTAVQQKMHDEELGEFNETDFNNLPNTLNSIINWNELGNWLDNPVDVTPYYAYQFVSIRKSIDGVWGPFSYPALWGNYSTSKFTTFAFTATETGVDLEDVVLTGGSFDNPVPGNTVLNGSTYEWTDGPEPNGGNGRILIWMTSAVVVEGKSISGWTSPKKMIDANGFQIEWCSAESIPNAVKQRLESNEFCFESYMINANQDESIAEPAWRTDVRDTLGLVFSDDAENAVYMATAQVKNSVWQNWKVVKVKGEKGEKGDPGTSIRVNGRIAYEVYLPENTAYTYSSAQQAFSDALSSLSPSPTNGNLLVVYPHDMTGDIYIGDPGNGDGLYMWKYNGSQWIDYNDSSTNGETEGSSYVSPNKHLILWDGDSWQDIGELEGPEGKQWVLVVKYANDASDGVSKEFVADMDIPSAKWVGTLVYLDDGLNHDFALNNPNYISTDLSKIRGWQWSLFKGQDGYGYEYIFKPTQTNDPPQVPDYTATDQYTKPNVVPNGRSITNSNILQSGWYDEPLEPNANNKYIWMCWRKYDHQTGRWTKFMGKESGVFPDGSAKLWQIFSKSIDEVYEYFHADSSISPNFPATGEMVDVPSGFLDFWHAKEEVIGSGATASYKWNETNRYLFNIEVISYTDGTIKVLDPHYISVFADGIVDIVDYYVLDTDGSSAPNITSGVPTTSGSSSTEGTSWWTTNASKTTISEDYPYLWNISKKEYENGDVDWSTPMVVAVFGIGQNGESAVYLDLDNEMDVIQIDENRIILENMTFESTICMYNGTSLINIKKIEVSGEEGFGSDFKLYRSSNGTSWTSCSDGSTWTNSNNVKYINMTLNLGVGGILPSEYSKIQFTVTSVNDDIRTAYYTLVGTTNPSLYSIQLSSNVVIKKENGSYEPSSLSVSVVKKTGSDRSVYTSNQTGEGGFKLYLGNDLLSSYTITSTMLRSYDIGDKLEFELYVDTNDTDTAVDTMMDAETVYVVGEGTGYDDSWLKTLLSGSTDITGALVMTGDLLARNASGVITAGVMGHDYRTNATSNIRFFAGNTGISNLSDSTSTSFISKVESSPFRVTEGGKLYATDAVISGEITASKLTIAGTTLSTNDDVSNWVNSYVSIPESGDEYDDSWLTKAFNKTTISGGVVATGNILVQNSSNRITAGMMGYDTSASDDIRFFAGTTVASTSTSSQIMSAAKNAPFRVDESGNMYASKGQIAGLSISSTGLQLGDNIFIGNDPEYGDCIKISDYNGNVNVFNANGLRMGGTFAAKTAFIIDDLSDPLGSSSTTVTDNLRKTYGILSDSDISTAFINYDIISPIGCGEITIPYNKYFVGRRITLMAGHPLISQVLTIVSNSGASYSQSMATDAHNCTFKFSSSSCKFYEDGGSSNILVLQNEGVEIVGIGNGDQFKGFMVTRRYNMTTSYDYGHELRCLGVFKVKNNAVVDSTTFNGVSGSVSSYSTTSGNYYITIKTPFRVSEYLLNKIVVNVIPESGLYYFNTELSVTDGTLYIKINGSTLLTSQTFKVMVFNLGDFSSLQLDSTTAPSLVSAYCGGGSNPTSYPYNAMGGISWLYNEYGTGYANGYPVPMRVRLTVSDNTNRIDYSLASGDEFIISGGNSYMSTTSSKTVTLPMVYPGRTNQYIYNNDDNLVIVLHTSSNGSSDSADITRTVLIPLTQYSQQNDPNNTTN